MAYAGRMPDKSRALTVLTVAGLHGMALYGLVTGLGVDYVKDAITVLQGHNIPAEVSPPPPPEQVFDEAVSKPTTQPTSRPIEAVPNTLVTRDPIIVPIGPIEPFVVDPPVAGPTIAPTPDKPLLTPRSVRPRNNPGGWVSTNDYPPGALRREEQGAVRFELAIGADGRVTGCRITASSGFPDLEAATCSNVTRRARFEPASDATGARVPGSYNGSIRWVIPQD
jgi:periplasmic protein TonB